MSCPNCSQAMTEANFDNQSILHCLNCGASFFEENSINRISYKSAETLAQEKKTSIIIGRQKLCPKDNTPLTLVQNKELVPSSISLFRCNKCHGVFAYPEDLVNFKKAQLVKIDFFRIWNKPLPALKTVLLFSFIVFFTLLTITGSTLHQKNISQTQAKDLINKVDITVSSRYLFISFITQIPLKSEIRFINKTSGVSFVQSVSNVPKTIHILTTDRVNPKEKIFYQLILTDEKGGRISSEEKKLELH